MTMIFESLQIDGKLIQNNEQGFSMPYQIYGELDREYKLQKYFRLTNISKSPLIQKDKMLYGGVEYK